MLFLFFTIIIRSNVAPYTFSQYNFFKYRLDRNRTIFLYITILLLRSCCFSYYQLSVHAPIPPYIVKRKQFSMHTLIQAQLDKTKRKKSSYVLRSTTSWIEIKKKIFVSRVLNVMVKLPIVLCGFNEKKHNIFLFSL